MSKKQEKINKNVSIYTPKTPKNSKRFAAWVVDMILIIVVATGIAFLTEFAVSVCADAGEKAIASKIEIGSKVIIITMSIPIITSLLELIIEILP